MLSISCGSVSSQECFGIRFIDQQDNRPIPLVEIETVDHVKLVSDNDGWIAIDDPELLGSEVFFHIRSHGYEYPKDGFGFSGKTITCEPGNRISISLKRTQLAQRLYRSTGIGRYSHIQRLEGKSSSDSEDSFRGKAFHRSIGCDSVLTAVLGNKMYWFWGDTSSLHYPIGGSFHMTGATTLLGDMKLETAPPTFAYFRDDRDQIRPVAKMPGEGPTWVSGLAVVKNAKGEQVLVGNYVKIRNQLEAYRWGFVRWNSTVQGFEQLVEFPESPKLFPPSQSHTFERVDSVTNQNYIYVCSPFPHRRVLATEAAYSDPEQYEGFTCLQDGTHFDDRKIERDSQGVPIYRWRRNTMPLTQVQESALVAEGLLSDHHRFQKLRDIDSQAEIQAHNGSVVWNPYRKAWVAVFTQFGGEASVLGHVWYSESREPEGPFRRAKKIASHNQYSFYNPKIHGELGSSDGKTMYFEGTYTAAFSGNQAPTPRYDYNQILYRLDLGLFDEVNFGD